MKSTNFHLVGKHGMFTVFAIAAVAIAAIALSMASFPASVSAANGDAPTGLTVSSGSNPGDLHISWDAHADNAVDYRVAWKPQGGSFKSHTNTGWNAFPSTNQYTVTGLTAGQTYKVKVRARFGGNDKSNWSAVVSGVAAEEPPPQVEVKGENPKEGENDDDEGNGPRLHSNPSPWTGHALHDIRRKQTHELPSDGSVWYRLSNLTMNRVHLFVYDKGDKSKRSTFTDKTDVKRPKLKIYHSNGNAVVQNGHAVEAKPRRLSTLYFVPATSSTYYLSVSSQTGDGGGFRLRYSRKWATSLGDRTTGDCDVSVNARNNSCRIMPSDTSVDFRINNRNDSDRFWLFPEHGVTYDLCLTPEGSGAERAYLYTTSGNLSTYPILVMENPIAGREKCVTFTQPKRTTQLQFHVTIYRGQTTKVIVPMNYTVRFEKQ